MKNPQLIYLTVKNWRFSLKIMNKTKIASTSSIHHYTEVLNVAVRKINRCQEEAKLYFKWHNYTENPKAIN